MISWHATGAQPGNEAGETNKVAVKKDAATVKGQGQGAEESGSKLQIKC